jgi:hypothetical protein
LIFDDSNQLENFLQKRGGEIVNKRVLIIVVALMAAAVLMFPVMAEPTKGQKVPASMTPTALIGAYPPAEQWVSDDGVVQIRGQVQIRRFALSIGDQDYTGVTTSLQDASNDPTTSVVVARIYATHLVDGMNGGFTGVVEMKLYNFNPVTFTWDWETWHSIADGFGDFEGQKLMLSYEGVPNGPRTGYCLKG